MFSTTDGLQKRLYSMPRCTHPTSGQPSTRSPVEFIADSPPNFRSGGDLPIMGLTPPWLKRRNDPPANASPSPLPYYALPPLEIISVPPQAKYLIVSPPPEDPVLRDHVPRAKGSKPKAKPHNITIVPASRPVALLTAHTPSVPPPISAVFHGPVNGGHGQGNRSTPGTPYSPEPSPYIDPALSTGLPRALGIQAYPIRTQRPWRHGG
ncbi:hypothetical protein B0H13DRAFT_448166 [Mycena leptocephala]|nr:hypothetical protein B0H13DRAFT_448166 [Mycena leptocephala]